MGKKLTDFDDYDDDIVIDKKLKRKLARQAAREEQQQQHSVQTEQDDTMSRVALLCQENRWREAVLLCRQSMAEAEEKGENDLVFTLQMALPKLEYSLRRQMVAALVNGMKNMKME
ncbi:MAG: hypothetical protein IKS92_06980 [Victivallales bacterium]|nr:hypothetical protein [Victivallales bacterium]MBR5025738.1 hypothetical protein [Victivallales bacterium]